MADKNSDDSSSSSNPGGSNPTLSKLTTLVFDSTVHFSKQTIQQELFDLLLTNEPDILKDIGQQASILESLKALITGIFRKGDEARMMTLLRFGKDHPIVKYIRDSVDLELYFWNTTSGTSPELTKLFLENDFNLSFLHHLPLRYSAKNGSLELVKLLVTPENINDYDQSEMRNSALDYAVINDRFDVIEYLFISWYQQTCYERVCDCSESKQVIFDNHL